jgi:hypothetical protein
MVLAGLRASAKCSDKCEVRQAGACWRVLSDGHNPQASCWSWFFGVPHGHTGEQRRKWGPISCMAQLFCPPPMQRHACPPWPDPKSPIRAKCTCFVLLSLGNSNFCVEVVAICGGLMLWLPFLQTVSFEGPELAVNASVQPQTKTDRMLTLQRAAVGAQLILASGAGRLRAPKHRGWTKQLSLLMDWGTDAVLRGTRPLSARGMACCPASGGLQGFIGSRSCCPKRPAKKQRGPGLDPGSHGACWAACFGKVLG